MPQTPTVRIAALAVAATVSGMFFVLLYLVPILRHYGTGIALFASVVAALSGAGLYRAASAALWKSFRTSLTLRKWMLGRNFLEGTWVGHYERGGQSVVTVEFHSQANDIMEINGHEIDTDGNLISQWTSYAAALDARGTSLIYAYHCDVMWRQGSHDGVAKFTLRRRDERSAAVELLGYAADLTDGKKDTNRQYKVSDTIIEDKDALEQARRLFPRLAMNR